MTYCAVGESYQLANPKKANHAAINTPLQLLVYRDLTGPFIPTTHGGYKFVRKISDQFTKWAAVYLLYSEVQNRALASFQLFVTSTVKRLGKRIIRWGADKGGKFTGVEFEDYCLGSGITYEFAVASTPQQVGVLEIFGRTLCRTVRSILADSGLPPFSMRRAHDDKIFCVRRSTRQEHWHPKMGEGSYVVTVLWFVG